MDCTFSKFYDLRDEFSLLLSMRSSGAEMLSGQLYLDRDRQDNISSGISQIDKMLDNLESAAGELGEEFKTSLMVLRENAPA